MDSVASFHCACAYGYTGPECETGTRDTNTSVLLLNISIPPLLYQRTVK